MFAFLCAARSGEVFGATWDEIDLEAGVWIVPPDRMKVARPHRVPLSAAAVDILRGQLAARGNNPHVFPGARPRESLSVIALAMAMRRLGAGEFSPHGFRSALRDGRATEPTSLTMRRNRVRDAWRSGGRKFLLFDFGRVHVEASTNRAESP
jgi:integrase